MKIPFMNITIHQTHTRTTHLAHILLTVFISPNIVHSILTICLYFFCLPLSLLSFFCIPQLLLNK